ncbi:hypothetical protein IFT98_07895 [Pseudomonas sp. CFBP 8770]|jgi:hypothetical protein|uniref:hypothetical protein n=1 Tax=unclassified Pseudomonas TaxID=196821 RepID=UPI0017846E98|nr:MULTISPECIES: hypothetical protein [unclassified Pseudomonas]MBD8473775.1 hypothetical protein [Pseudomonas sp. CFBP 8773]MBD8646904.1 hypothetical protein [Pseudomonas sp. CFBP 8770]
MDAVEEAVEKPVGKRVTRLSFMFARRDQKQAERITYSIGPIDSGERIESMWCDISSDFLTITMMVTPKDPAAGMSRSAHELTSIIKRSHPDQPIKSPKGSRRKQNPKADSGEEVAEMEAILRKLAAQVESISELNVVFRINDISGSDRPSNLLPPWDKKSLSVAGLKR